MALNQESGDTRTYSAYMGADRNVGSQTTADTTSFANGAYSGDHNPAQWRPKVANYGYPPDTSVTSTESFTMGPHWQLFCINQSYQKYNGGVTNLSGVMYEGEIKLGPGKFILVTFYGFHKVFYSTNYCQHYFNSGTTPTPLSCVSGNMITPTSGY